MVSSDERRLVKRCANGHIRYRKRGSLMKKFTTVGLGELLWDILPDSRQLGGAPANFRVHDEPARAIRASSRAASATMNLGTRPNTALKTSALPHRGYNSIRPIARELCSVEVDANGQPTLQIAEPARGIRSNGRPRGITRAESRRGMLWFARATVSAFPRNHPLRFSRTIRPETTRIFDVNLRQSFFSAQTLADSAKHADIIKLNNDELPIVVQLLRLSVPRRRVRSRVALPHISHKTSLHHARRAQEVCW